MAAAAREKALELCAKADNPTVPVIGIGITSAVATDHPRRGQDRAFLAVATPNGIWDVELKLGSYGVIAESDELRPLQAELIDAVALNMILWAAGIEQVPINRNFKMYCCADSRQLVDIDDVGYVVAPEVDEVVADGDEGVYFDSEYMVDGDWVEGDVLDDVFLLFPGSFGPLHYGHVEMAEMVQRMTGLRVVFQISNVHPIKGRVPEEDLVHRVLQFRYRWPVIVSQGGALYVEKAEMFPGMPMLVGADAVIELLNPVHYENGEADVFKALERFTELGTVFYVVGREVKKFGRFMTRDDISFPPRFAHLFRDVSCRNDVSSTQIREAE